MPKLRRVDPADRERLIGEIKAFAAQLRSCFPIEKIYLYGSFARGESTKEATSTLLSSATFGSGSSNASGAFLSSRTSR